MLSFVPRWCEAVGHFFSERSISQKTLARVCAAVFVCMLIPLIVVALYNYPSDDDFASALPAATAWVGTHDLGEVARALYDYAVKTYNTWQGNFVSSLFCTITPMWFNEDLYFLSNWFALALLCLSAGYLLKYLTRTLLGASRSVFWIVYTAFMVLALQFLPCMGEGLYWHTGAMYLVSFCTSMQLFGLLGHCNGPQSRARAVWRGVAAALCGLMLGGSFYGPAFGTLVFLLLLTVIAFVRRQPNRGFCLLSVCCFLLTFAFNLMAPGIAARQSATGEPTSPLMTVITTVLDSFDTFGGWLSPHLIAMLMLALPVLWKPLKESRLSFKHPFWFFVLMYGLFSASMAPGVYVMNTYDKGRYMNVIYLEFLLLAFAASAYAEGWLIRFLERRGGEKSGALRAARPLGQRFTALYLALSLALLTFGGFSFTIMNTSSVCALKSLVTGEAAQFRREMKQREEYIRVTPSDDTHVSQLSGQPYIFKADKLPLQGTFGRLRYMKWYFELFYSAEPPQGE